MFANPAIPLSLTTSSVKPRKTSLSQDTRIAQLAKQMAYERMIQEIDHQRYHSPTKKKNKSTTKAASIQSSSILTESHHVNHIINDVMIRILHDMFDKQQQQQQQQQQHQQQIISSISQPRASRKGELLFVKKSNIDEQFNSNLLNTIKPTSHHGKQATKVDNEHSVSFDEL
jgi:hypothetical protein